MNDTNFIRYKFNNVVTETLVLNMVKLHSYFRRMYSERSIGFQFYY